MKLQNFLLWAIVVVLYLICFQLINIANSLRTIAAPPIEMQFKLDEGVGEPLPEPSALLTHNEAGGYIEACGNLPGMVGDDC